jgi:acid phosphatase
MQRRIQHLAGACGALSIAVCVQASPPTWDHVVVVIEENHSQSQIIGNTGNGSLTDGAPYINELAAGGVRFNNFVAIMHPSQPNYLELFSGSNQNVTDDGLPAGMSTNNPFQTPNLGAEVLAAGRSFAGYSEDLPSTSLAADSSIAGGYRRKHNPWVNWQGAATNGLPVSTNKSFSAFPSDFTQLPNLSFVVPTQYNDMHDDNPNDGLTAVRAGDNWIRNNLQAYANWATTHNSLLIVTFDEDNGGEGNRIPTVMYGANLNYGTQVDSTWTLHNLQRTLEDSNHTNAHAGQAAKTRSIIGAFTSDVPVTTTRIQEGLNGYSTEHDTTIRADNPSTPLNSAATNIVDADTDNTAGNGKQVAQSLLRFDNVFGNGANQVPSSAVIQSAKLVLRGTTDSSENFMELHRMLIDWSSGTATWNAFNGDGQGGVQANDVEAASAETFHLVPDTSNVFAVFDITDEVLGWQNGTITNYGWMIQGIVSGQDGWTWNADSAGTVANRPMLEITWSTVPEPGMAVLSSALLLLPLRRRRG